MFSLNIIIFQLQVLNNHLLVLSWYVRNTNPFNLEIHAPAWCLITAQMVDNNIAQNDEMWILIYINLPQLLLVQSQSEKVSSKLIFWQFTLSQVTTILAGWGWLNRLSVMVRSSDRNHELWSRVYYLFAFRGEGHLHVSQGGWKQTKFTNCVYDSEVDFYAFYK